MKNWQGMSSRFLPVMRRAAAVVALAVFGVSLSACGPKPPIKLGFIGGLSGKFADLGTATRNGALLAVEQANAAGGVGGRQLMLVEQDDKQNNDQALLAMAELHKQGVAGVVGPSTSSIAVAVAPFAQANQLLLIAPTATTSKLTGRDDFFLRSVGDAAFYGKAAARFHYEKQGIRSAALVLDMANADYSESWGEPYAAELARLGGKVVAIERFKSTDNPDHAAIAQKLLVSQPQLVLTVASSVDSALIAQRVKGISPATRMAGAGWASTERLIELGGGAVEGMLFEQYFDRFDPSPKFQGFVAVYRERFKGEPGYAAVLAFDAANMLIAGLQKSDKSAELKANILGIGKFEGVQNQVLLDSFGDVSRAVTFGVVKDGKFAKAD